MAAMWPVAPWPGPVLTESCALPHGAVPVFAVDAVDVEDDGLTDVSGVLAVDAAEVEAVLLDGALVEADPVVGDVAVVVFGGALLSEALHATATRANDTTTIRIATACRVPRVGASSRVSAWSGRVSMPDQTGRMESTVAGTDPTLSTCTGRPRSGSSRSHAAP